MLQKPREIELTNFKDPWEFDQLDRKYVAKKLTRLVDSISQPFVLGLESPYGTGKTSFIKMWNADLRRQNYRTVYFNAWEHDQTSDPLMAFVAALKSELPKQLTPTGKKAFNYRIGAFSKDAALALAPRLLKAYLKTKIGITFDELFKNDEEENTEYGEIVSNEISEAAAKAVDALLKTYESAENSPTALRMYMESLAKDALTRTKGEGHQKIIVIVDELDRCRPLFAIELLECIKHFFNSQGYLFILSYDPTHLKSTIRGIYGSAIDVEGYAARFIDWRFSLPQPNTSSFVGYLWQQFGLDDLIDRGILNEDANFIFGKNAFMDAFSSVAAEYNLSLRHQARAFTDANLVFRTTPRDEAPWAWAVGFLSVLRHADGDYFETILSGSARNAKGKWSPPRDYKNYPGPFQSFHPAGLLVDIIVGTKPFQQLCNSSEQSLPSREGIMFRTHQISEAEQKKNRKIFNDANYLSSLHNQYNSQAKKINKSFPICCVMRERFRWIEAELIE